MARDYSGIFNVEDMSDDELHRLIVQELNEYPNLDPGWIDVDVQDGFVTLGGSVGTDGEKQIAEKVVVEVLGVRDYANELVVNALHREDLPEAVDDALRSEEELGDQLGGDLRGQADTASHLVEDLQEQTFGTHDMQQAIQNGTTYIPPDRAVPDGYDSEERH